MSKYQFTLPSSSGSDFNSAEHLPLVVYFYPKDSTPGCTTEGLDFNARLEQFKALGYTVVGISRDGVKSHQNFCAKQGFQFELLSDKEETVCKLFDVIKLKKLYGKESLGIEPARLCWTKTAKSPMSGAKSKWPDTRRKFWIQSLKPLNRALKT